MAEKTTWIKIPDASGFVERGHVSYSEAVVTARRYYELTLAEAQRALAAIDRGDVQVFHQRGVHFGRDRREVTPTCSTCQDAGTVDLEGIPGAPGSGGTFTCPDCRPTPIKPVEASA